MDDVPHITVCICTFQRREMLLRLLRALARQETGGDFTYSVVVTDNDPSESARNTVEDFRRYGAISVTYSSEPRKNIALARNKALQHATGEFVAFIDDDEFPEDDWLLKLLTCCEAYSSAGVLGPVRPHFEEPPPGWIIKGRFCERPEHPTGHIVHWEGGRTGNLLFRRSILLGEEYPFREQFGTGGEDKDFFMRMNEKGQVFRWCNEAVVHETVPPARWTRSYMLKRALLRGKNVLKHPRQKARLLATSLVAFPAYTCMLPFTLLLGQHVFMRYCIRWCDHVGRLLAFIRMNPVSAR